MSRPDNDPLLVVLERCSSFLDLPKVTADECERALTDYINDCRLHNLDLGYGGGSGTYIRYEIDFAFAMRRLFFGVDELPVRKSNGNLNHNRYSVAPNSDEAKRLYASRKRRELEAQRAEIDAQLERLN